MLVNVFSYWDKPSLHYLIRGTCELSLYWIIPGSNCVNIKKNTLRFMLSLLGHTQFTNMQIRLDLAYKLREHTAFTFPITIPTHKLNTVIKYNPVS